MNSKVRRFLHALSLRIIEFGVSWCILAAGVSLLTVGDLPPDPQATVCFALMGLLNLGIYVYLSAQKPPGV